MRHLRAIVEAISARYGLVPQPDWSERIDRGLAVIAKELGTKRDALWRRLPGDRELLRRLAGHLTVEETFFFRQPDHFAALVAHLRRRLLAGGAADKVRVWSAGCAGGDEPYSLAIALTESLEASLVRRVEILANDLNLRALERARAGLFRSWSFRTQDPARLRRHFTITAEGDHWLREGIREMVCFEHIGIQQMAGRLQDRSLDAIMFRNVSLYLDPRSSGELYGRFSRLLREDGWLLVASSDQRPSRELFVAHDSFSATIFLPNTAETRARRRRQTGPLGVSVARDRRPLSGAHRRVTPSSPAHLASVVEPARAPRRATTPPPADLLARARQRADRGDYDGALTACDALIALEPTLADAHQLRGELLFHMELYRDAVLALRKAMDLADSDLIIRYWYALALQASGRTQEAHREAADLQACTAALAEDQLLSDGRTRAAELLNAARTLKRSLG